MNILRTILHTHIPICHVVLSVLLSPLAALVPIPPVMIVICGGETSGVGKSLTVD